MSNSFSVRPPKYRRHKATGQAVVTIDTRDLYLGKYNSAARKERYRQLVAEFLQTGFAASPERQQEITVAEVMAAYLRFARSYYRKNGTTTREYGLIVECCRHIKPLYGRNCAVDFGPRALKTVRNSMIEAQHSRKDINKNVEQFGRQV
ncbi:MAG: hypothetical protein WD030_04400 [Pirellulales bacterium]